MLKLRKKIVYILVPGILLLNLFSFSSLQTPKNNPNHEFVELTQSFLVSASFQSSKIERNINNKTDSNIHFISFDKVVLSAGVNSFISFAEKKFHSPVHFNYFITSQFSTST